MTPDLDRLRRAVAGDPDALGELLRIHGPAVGRTLRIDPPWRVHLDPLDVMQITYIEAFQQIHDFDLGRPDRFESWLRQMAENNLRDALRGLTRQKRGGPDAAHNAPLLAEGSDLAPLHPVAADARPSQALRRDERGAQLQEALSRLPPDYAQAVRLLDLEGRPVPEVAAALGRSAGAVHMLRARALDRLRELLGPASAFLTSS